VSIKNAVAIKRRDDYRRYKSIVTKRQRDFVETGTALGMIKRDELHKEGGYPSFEAFVETEFDMPRTTAYRFIDAARVVTILSQVGTIQEKIVNQSQALQLAPLGHDREAMTAVVTEAERRGRITAAALDQVRTELYPHVRVIEGEVVRPPIGAPERPAIAGADPLDSFPEAQQAVEKKLHQQAAAGVTPPADGDRPTADIEGTPAAGTEATSHQGEADRSVPAVTPTEDHRDAIPGETDDAGPSSGTTDSATERRPSSLPLPADEVEEQAPAGVTAPAPPIPEQLEERTEEQDDDLDGDDLPPLPHAGDPAALIAWFADRFDQVDPDVTGPLLPSDDLALIAASLDRIVFVVDRLTDWHERARP
jgi:hypothetical protein